MKKRNREEKRVQEERYRFIEEQIRPNRDYKRKKYLLHLLRLVVMASVAGVVFGVVFSIAIDWLEQRQSRGSSVVSTPVYQTQTAQPTPQSTLASVEIDDREVREVLAGYQKVQEAAAKVGERCESFLVQVAYGKYNHTWLEDADVSSEKGTATQWGILFDQDDQNYYILSPYFEGDTSKITVRFPGNTEAKASLCGYGEGMGLCVVAVAREEVNDGSRDLLHIASFVGREKMEKGLSIILIGCPQGIAHGVRLGTVVQDDIRVAVEDMQLQMCSTDIAWSEQSCGFAVDLEGNILGVIDQSHVSRTGKEECAFLRLDVLIDEIDAMKKGRTQPYLGVIGSDYSNLRYGQGVYVEEIVSNSPAFDGGLRVGDILVELAGQSVTDVQSMHEILSAQRTSKKLTAKVLRRSGSQVHKRKCTVILK